MAADKERTAGAVCVPVGAEGGDQGGFAEKIRTFGSVYFGGDPTAGHWSVDRLVGCGGV